MTNSNDVYNGILNYNAIPLSRQNYRPLTEIQREYYGIYNLQFPFFPYGEFFYLNPTGVIIKSLISTLRI
jgi:hypothetical protein